MVEVYFKKPRLVDIPYLKSAKGKKCIICRAKGTTVMHHILYGNPQKGKGLKPSDNHTIPLCVDCHAECHRGERKFYEKNIDKLTKDPISFAEELYLKGKFEELIELRKNGLKWKCFRSGNV